MLGGSWPSQIEGSKALYRRIARELLIREITEALQRAAERQAEEVAQIVRRAA